jgi:hypothetical protein
MALSGGKTLKNRLNNPFGPIWALLGNSAFFAIFRLFRQFLVIFSLNKAFDERVGGVPHFWVKGEYPPP